MYGWNHGSWVFGDGGGWMVFGWLWILLIWMVPALILFALLKYLFSSHKSMPPGQKEIQRSALDILDEAYARGEFSREDYLQRREDLRGK